MLAEIISIGDELTTGQRLDTNSQWLAQQLGDLGVTTMYHTTVADDLAANVRVFGQAIDRADLVIATGGLGPTADDLTREAIAKVAAVELALDQPSLDHIRQLFVRFKRDMPERNVVQAMFPAGSRPIPNANGTAPGIDMLVAATSDDHFARIFALPGVPAEMKEMFAQTVAPAISAMQPSPRVIRHRRIKCFGAGESQVEAMLPDLIARKREPLVGITVHAATITLRITASGATEEECFAAMEPTIATIRECLGDLVFGEEDDELEHVVLRLLAERKKTLYTAELGTSGLLANWLATANPPDGPYLGGQVLPNEPNPRGRTDVRVLLDDQDPRVRRSDCLLVVGPFHDPIEGQPSTYFISLGTESGEPLISSTLAGHSSIWKPRAAKQALNLLRLHLLRQEG